MLENIIKTDNYLIVGSNDDIKRGWFYCVRTKSIFQDEGEDVHCCIGDIRIVAHLPLNGAEYLEGVDLLPPIEDEVDILLKIEQEDAYKNGKGTISWYELDKRKEYYNKAKEKYAQLIEKQISDFTHDLRESTNNYIKQNCEGALFGLKRLKQSLQQQKYPIGFECDKEWENSKGEKGSSFNDVALYEESIRQYDAWLTPKTTTNSQGQTVLEGKYIYE